jgi:hypothetical protein
LHHAFQLVHVDGLAQEVVGAVADSAQRVFLVALSRNHNHFGERISREQGRQRGQALLRIVRTGRQPEIEQGDGRPARRECRHRCGPILGGDHFVVGRQRPLHLRSDVFIVVHDEERRFAH